MIKNDLEDIVEMLCDGCKDADKFDRGNATAGTRIRKRAMEVIKLLKDMRAEIIEVRNDRKENKQKKG